MTLRQIIPTVLSRLLIRRRQKSCAVLVKAVYNISGVNCQVAGILGNLSRLPYMEEGGESAWPYSALSAKPTTSPQRRLAKSAVPPLRHNLLR